MRYMCLVWFDPEQAFDGSAESNAILDASGGYDRTLAAEGRLVATEALQLPDSARTVRVRDGQVSVTDGPFIETREILGGFLLVEAADLDEAVRLAAGIPLARLGSIEVRPVVDFSQPRPTL